MTRALRRAAAALLLGGVSCGDGSLREVELRGALEASAERRRSLTLRLLDVTDSRIGGQAVLLSDSSGGEAKHVLVDGGERPATVADALRHLGVRDLALIVLTHAHFDHYGGLERVVRTLPVAAFAYNGDARSLASFRRLLRAVEQSRARAIVVDSTVRTVTVVSGGDTLLLRLLPPPPRSPRIRGDPINNRSVGVLIRYGRFSALIPGDAEHAAQRWWGKHFGDSLDVDLLVASHHGSRDANSTARRRDWYRTVTPRLLLVSANGRQHPFAEVLDYARAQGIPSYCTANHGSIAVHVSRAGNWSVRTERTAACTPGFERSAQPTLISLPR